MMLTTEFNKLDTYLKEHGITKPKEFLWITPAVLYVSLPFIIIQLFNFSPPIVRGFFTCTSETAVLGILFYYRSKIKKQFSKLEIIFFTTSFITILAAEFFYMIIMNTINPIYKNINPIYTLRIIFTFMYSFLSAFISLFFIVRMKNFMVKDKAWDKRFNQLSADEHGIQVFHLSSPNALREWVSNYK